MSRNFREMIGAKYFKAEWTNTSGGQAIIAQRIKLVTWTCDPGTDICVFE